MTSPAASKRAASSRQRHQQQPADVEQQRSPVIAFLRSFVGKAGIAQPAGLGVIGLGDTDPQQVGACYRIELHRQQLGVGDRKRCVQQIRNLRRRERVFGLEPTRRIVRTDLRVDQFLYRADAGIVRNTGAGRGAHDQADKQ